MKSLHRLSLFIAVAYFLSGCNPEKPYQSWEVYRGDDGTNAYSALEQINTGNVNQLEVAWTYRTGDPSEYVNLECNPIVVNNVLYGISPRLKTFALDAKTGKQIWVFDPFEKEGKTGGVGRGLNYWKGQGEQRLFLFADNKLIALDPETGKQIMTFGDSGYVDLNSNLRSHEGLDLRENVKNTSPGVIFNDMIITGSAVGEEYESSPGHIRAYDVRTGKMKWIFHTVPQPGELGYDTWPKDAYKTAGGCNAWSGLSIDRKRGIVFAATGSPSFDFHGGERHGQNLFGNSVIAIDAATGKYIWHYQVLHHDLWDYDLPSPPNLVTVKRDNKMVDAVAQITKQGFVFVFDRETGMPLFTVEEKPVAVSTMPGEQSWPTQPIPTKPPVLNRIQFDESIITDISREVHDSLLAVSKKYTHGSIYFPPNLEGIIQMPGYRGGGEWSGACVDLETAIMYVGINDIPNITQLLRRENENNKLANLPLREAGAILYGKNCAACHGKDRQENKGFPPLMTVAKRLKPTEVKLLMEKGRGLMPAFTKLDAQDKDALIAYLFELNIAGRYLAKKDSASVPEKVRYRLKGYTQFLDKAGHPGIKPPWGTLNAIDLNTGEIAWRVPLGEYPDLAAKGIRNTGTQLFGGGIVTAGGLIFIGAAQDEKFRAIDKATGKVVWEYLLPAGGYATPSTYEVDDKQYIVIAAGGGGRQLTRAGDYYVAFALKGK